MTVSGGPLAAALAVVSVASLGLLSLMCLRCKKRKTKTIHEEPQIYTPQTFETVKEAKFPRVSGPASRTASSSPDDDYIAPIEGPVYENDSSAVQRPVESSGVYGNIFTADDDDYENEVYLKQHQDKEDSDHDYVNQDEGCTGSHR